MHNFSAFRLASWTGKLEQFLMRVGYRIGHILGLWYGRAIVM